MRMSPEERFRGRFKENEEGCWIWQGAPTSSGYGLFCVNGRQRPAHRFSHELFVGPIPEGLEIDHLCRVRLCVNPDHLEAVTGRENMLRGESLQAQNARKTHCPQGHQYDEENTYIDKRGSRNCRECMRAMSRRRSKLPGHKDYMLNYHREYYWKNVEAKRAYAREQYWKKKAGGVEPRPPNSTA